MASAFEQVIVFMIVFGSFFPFITKVVRLGSRTFDERQHLERERIIQVFVLVPGALILAFFAVYFGVLFLVDLILFS